MFETQVTVVGNLVTDIDEHRLNDGTAVANFRVGSTERRYDRSNATWVDGERLYIDVRCWRDLAENAGASLAKGDPVVVTGRIFTRSYDHQGQRRSTPTIEASSVAADLGRCRVALTRTRRGVAIAERTLAGAPGGGPSPAGAGAADRTAGDEGRASGAPEEPGGGAAGTGAQLVGVVPGDEA